LQDRHHEFHEVLQPARWKGVMLNPAAPQSAAARARFFNSGNAFNIKLPPVPAADLAAVLAEADAPTGLRVCDQSDAVGCGFPATAPLMLARHARIRAGEALEFALHAAGLIAHVLRGTGEVSGKRASPGPRATSSCCPATSRGRCAQRRIS
jgi:hypothetical protein